MDFQFQSFQRKQKIMNNSNDNVFTLKNSTLFYSSCLLTTYRTCIYFKGLSHRLDRKTYNNLVRVYCLKNGEQLTLASYPFTEN